MPGFWETVNMTDRRYGGKLGAIQQVQIQTVGCN